MYQPVLPSSHAGQRRRVAVAGAVDENLPAQPKFARFSGDPDGSHNPLQHLGTHDRRIQQAGDSVRLQHFIQHELHILVFKGHPVLRQPAVGSQAIEDLIEDDRSDVLAGSLHRVRHERVDQPRGRYLSQVSIPPNQQYRHP
jgi:hypothetical protein